MEERGVHVEFGEVDQGLPLVVVPVHNGENDQIEKLIHFYALLPFGL